MKKVQRITGNVKKLSGMTVILEGATVDVLENCHVMEVMESSIGEVSNSIIEVVRHSEIGTLSGFAAIRLATDQTLIRNMGDNTRIGILDRGSIVQVASGYSVIDLVADDSIISEIYDHCLVLKLIGKAQVCQAFQETRILEVTGGARVAHLYDQAKVLSLA